MKALFRFFLIILLLNLMSSEGSKLIKVMFIDGEVRNEKI